MRPIQRVGDGVRGSTERRVTAPRLSLLIVARNEERQLEPCIRSGDFADEIVVLLDRSKDDSAEIAAVLGAKVVAGEWPDEGQRRTVGIAACSGDWILELDADERISPALAAELRTAIRAGKADHYVIPFRNHIGDRWVKSGWGAYNGVNAKASLFRRGHKTWSGGRVHPAIVLSGTRGELRGHIDHYVDEDLTTMYDRLNRYTTLAAADAVERDAIPRAGSTIRRFFSRFIRSYAQKRGYREGWRGVALALFSALYPVLTYLKIRERLERR